MTTNGRCMRPKEPVPQLTCREEEARVWDTHDLADYWDEFKPVRVRFAKDFSEGLTIRLDPETLQVLRERAREKGPGPHHVGADVDP